MSKKTNKGEPPPKVWPFPTWKGAPYKMPRRLKTVPSPAPAVPELPEALM